MPATPPSPRDPTSGTPRPDGANPDRDVRAATPEQGPGNARWTPSRPALLTVAVGSVALVALVLIALQREPAQFPADSPEATVQAWLQSVVEDTPDTSLLAPRDCLQAPRLYGPDDLRVAIRDTTIEADTARVELTVTEGTGGDMFGGSYSHDETYYLRRDDGTWLITKFDWPYDECWNATVQEG